MIIKVVGRQEPAMENSSSRLTSKELLEHLIRNGDCPVQTPGKNRTSNQTRDYEIDGFPSPLRTIVGL